MATNQEQQLQILAISGGGYRGLHAAKILADFEEKFGTPAREHFEVLAGTSIGGILALWLASGKSAAEFVSLLQTHGPEVFAPRGFLGGYTKAKHSNAALRACLEKHFGDLRLGALKAFVLIPAVDASTGKPVVFKTPHHPDLRYDYERRVVDVALATSAAPVYFPIFEEPGSKRLFTDGGLIANAPGFFGFHEATHYFEKATADVRIMAIGTASIGRNVRFEDSWWRKLCRELPFFHVCVGDDALDKGVLDWRARIFDVTISAQESVTNYMLTHVLKPDNYVRVDSTIDVERAKDVESLDSCTPAATHTLLAQASATAQAAVSDPRVRSFFNNNKQSLPWYYGPNATPQK